KTECGVLCIDDARRCDGAVIVGIRPEDIRLGRPSNDDENRIEGEVVSSTFLGDQVVAEVKINERTLIAKAAPDDGKPVGNMSVHLPKSKLVVFPDLAEQQSPLDPRTKE
ncbi:MAG TPA: TOBE domain-containing protein, partial [Candidatus Saccharimonadales bacterium]|nr:TOBE domain-containing protein [Candidatus Saccharimonadales bacterium]